MKRSLQAIANFFQMAVAIDENNKAYLYSKRPHWKDSDWRVIGGGTEVFAISRELIDHTGDCRDSLALPESWPQFNEGELVIHCLDEKQIAIWPPTMDRSEVLWPTPTAEEKAENARSLVMETLTIREALELSAELWLHVSTSRMRPYEDDIKANAIETRQREAMEKFGLKYVVGNCWLCQCTSCSVCPLSIGKTVCTNPEHPYYKWDILRDKLYRAHQRNDKEAIVALAVKADAEAAKVLAIINKALEVMDAK